MGRDVRRCIGRVRVHLPNLLVYDLTYFNTRAETSLRSPNNYVFSADHLVMSIAQWYQTYSTTQFRESYIVLPKHVQRKSKGNPRPYAFSVELYINVEQVWSRFVMTLPEYSHAPQSTQLGLTILSLQAPDEPV